MKSSTSTKEEISKSTEYKGIINIALAGNANVGKSVIFNQLTGLSQTIGNWPGKTVERMEGFLNFLGYRINMVDLPGIYSLSTYSLEEIVSREFIVSEDVDILINVIDATNLERNLFFTFQLLELKIPMIIAINQMDILHKRKIDLDFKKLEDIFKLPVIPVVAVHGTGVLQLLEEAIELFVYHHHHSHYVEGGKEIHEGLTHRQDNLEKMRNKIAKIKSMKQAFQFPDLSSILSYGKEVEKKIKEIIKKIDDYQEHFSQYNYPTRFLAIKILENDEEIKKIFEANKQAHSIIDFVDEFRKDLEHYHGEDINTIISSEIYQYCLISNNSIMVRVTNNYRNFLDLWTFTQRINFSTSCCFSKFHGIDPARIINSYPNDCVLFSHDALYSLFRYYYNHCKRNQLEICFTDCSIGNKYCFINWWSHKLGLFILYKHLKI